MKIKNKHQLKQKECCHIIKEIQENLNHTITCENSIIETGKINDHEFIFLNGVPYFFRKDQRLFFTLKGLMHFNPSNHYVIVDMGAVKFVTNGADVMAPGVVNADKEIKIDDFVWICDETYKKPLAVGIAVMAGEEMKEKTKGKAVILTHYIGDTMWKSISSL